MITSFFKPKSRKETKDSSLSSISTDRDSSTTTTSDSGSSTKRERQEEVQRNEEDSTNDTSSCVVIAPSSSKRVKNSTSKLATIAPSAVNDLISHLQSHSEEKPTWKSDLARTFASQQFVKLAAFVAAERKSRVVYPSPVNTWTALNSCPLSTLKVVIVGQDPYHGPNQAHGLAFSVERGLAVPPSLKNIYKELRDDPAIPDFTTIPTHGSLMRWAQQGVLMLNTVLTVRSGEPNSHAKRGWEAVTDDILRAVVNRTHRDKKAPVVFLLWGKPATAKAQSVLTHASNSHHVVICTSHPSPLGATKTSSPFLGSRCFSRCNQALVEMGLAPIDWKVDGPL